MQMKCRVLASLAEAESELGGNRPSAVCREPTKLHEEVVRGTLSEVREALSERASIKGELVIVVGTAD